MPDTNDLLNHIWDAPPKTRTEALGHLLKIHPELAEPAAHHLLRRNLHAECALGQSQRSLAELQGMLDEMAQPPLLVAGVVAVDGDRCLVAVGTARHEVGIHPSVR